MGYTHYWTQSRRFTNAQWAEIKTDIATILFQAKDEGLALGDGMGEVELSPVLDAMVVTYPDVKGEIIAFNGIGGDAHETFQIYQNRRPLEEWQKPDQHGWDFCKTARKPYDVAVTAILCYLESCYSGQISADSDGDQEDWIEGLELARRALPTKTNMLQIPFSIRFESQFDWTRSPITWSKTYEMKRRTNGEWLFFHNRNPYRPVAYVPAKHEKAFLDEMRIRAQNLPMSAAGAADCKVMHRKHDNAVRGLLTYSEVVIGTPDGLTVPA